MRSSRPPAAALAGLALITLVATGTALAQNRMPRLPDAFTFTQAGDSPGKVTFNHASHVAEDAPSCTACHPKLFRILKAGATADGKPITHDAMAKGQYCGTCHNGKKSFAFDDCTMCHRTE